MKRLLLRIIYVAIAVSVIYALSVTQDNLLHGYWQDVVMQCGIAVILAVSLNIVNGFTGQFSIGHAGFMAVGAYTGGAVSYLIWNPAKDVIATAHPTWGSDQVLAAFSASHWWVLPAGMIIGGLAAALFGLAVGIPSLRLRGDYLAIVTLGFGEIIRVILENVDKISDRASFLGGSIGFLGVPRLTTFSIVFGTAALVIALTRNLKVSLHGLAFQSIREDEIAADAMGVNTTRVKVAAFALGAFFAGMGGALFSHAYLVQPKSFGFILSINYVVMIVLGGTGSITGATIAAVVLTFIPEGLKNFKDAIPWFRDEYRWVIYAILLVVMMVVRPQGVFGRSELSLARFRKKRKTPKRESAHSTPVKKPPITDPVLRVNECSKTFGGLTAVSELNIALNSGEVVGLIGPNGAGKTTVFNLLTGVYEPSSGTVEFAGQQQAGDRPYKLGPRVFLIACDTFVAGFGGWIIGDILSSSTQTQGSPVMLACVLLAAIMALASSLKRRMYMPGYRPCQFAENGIARTFQNIRLFPDLSVLQNVELGSYTRRRTNLFDALFRTARMEREDAAVEDHAQRLLHRFGLDQFAELPARNLPYGAQRKLEIARALATEPKLLLLDEPAAGMNPQEKAELMVDIVRLRDEFDVTILLIEHDMGIVMGICERIYVLDYGEIIAEGTPEQIRNNPKVISAYLGEEIPSC